MRSADSIARRARAGSAAPEMTAQDCGSESMLRLLVGVRAERRAVVEERRADTSRHPRRSARRPRRSRAARSRYSAAMPRSPGCFAIDIARRSRSADRGTSRARRSRRGLSTPTRFMPSFQSPVPDQRQAVRAQLPGVFERAAAMLPQRRVLIRNRRAEHALLLIVLERQALPETEPPHREWPCRR